MSRAAADTRQNQLRSMLSVTAQAAATHRLAFMRFRPLSRRRPCLPSLIRHQIEIMLEMVCRIDRWQLGGIILLVRSQIDAADVSVGASASAAAADQIPAEGAAAAAEGPGTEAVQEADTEAFQRTGSGVLVRAKMEYQVLLVESLSQMIRFGYVSNHHACCEVGIRDMPRRAANLIW